MRWENVLTNSANEVYQLVHDHKQLLTLTLHPFSNSARIETAEEKRVFLIRKEGFLRNKTIIRNEYGVKIGELGMENKERFIDINDQRFFYVVKNNPLAELVIYKESVHKPILTCGLEIANGNTAVHFDKVKNEIADSGLLMALCWYMFLPVAKENVVEYAGA